MDARFVDGRSHEMLVHLRVLTGNVGERQILIRQKAFRIGRADHCDLCPTDLGVSRHHCEIRYAGSCAWIRDLGCHNGTFVNGEEVFLERDLCTGDRISFGLSCYEIELVTATASPMALPQAWHSFLGWHFGTAAVPTTQ
jgi:predicted component of type VI protein secretion system